MVNPAPLSVPPLAVRLGPLLGLTEGDDPAAWARVRGAQLYAGRSLALFMLGAHLVGAAIVAMIYAHRLPLWQLGGWAVAVMTAAVAVAVRRLRFPDRADGRATLGELRQTVAESGVLAILWSIAPVLASTRPDAPAALALWMVLSFLMIAAALAMAPVALAACAFIGSITLAVAVPLLVSGEHMAAASAALFGALLFVAAIGRARTLVLLRHAELALAERDETVSMLLREFADTGSDWLWETDAARRVVKASPRFAYACGLDPLTINGMPFLQVLAGPSWESGNFTPALRLLAEKLKARESFRDLALPVWVDGAERWWEIAASPRYDADGMFAGFRGVGSDITEQRTSADKISRMARFDTLTGLPNRLHVNEVLVRALAEAEKWQGRCAFMMIDLDRFKAVNDTLGHPVGDRLLGRVSERLSQLMTGNELVGRLGGDEFAVVVRDAGDRERLEQLARDIIAALSEPFVVDEHTLYIGASVGVAVSPRDGRAAETLIRSADLALYRSKDAGGGVFHSYEPQLHVDAEERRVLELALRQALELGELHLLYQPVVDSDSGLLRGFEALLRWHNPELGEVPPAKFIPLAQEARLIAPIGEWVLRTACAEAARWPAPTRVSVNVSPDQIRSPNFLAVVTSALAQSGLSPDRLELEVTEGMFLDEGPGTTRVLEQVLELGVHLSLDDFGTGHSSLGYLSRTRFSTIKVDRGFVRDAAEGATEAIAIIRAVVALARSLEMATTAKGVERESELAIAQELGCNRIQGYFFGRPLPAVEARRIAQRRESVAA